MYYILRYTLDDNEVGIFPQINKITDDYDETKETSFMNMSSKHFGDFDLNCFFLNPQSTLTDLLNNFILGLDIGIFISEKLKNILHDFYIPYARYIPIKIYQENTTIDYFFLHIITPPISWIDFEKSNFIISTIMDGKINTSAT